MSRMADDWRIRTEPVKVYLCDGTKPCISSPFCAISNKEDGLCKHTADYNHAKNRYRDDYEMIFEKVETGDLWEVEDGKKNSS